MNINRQNPEFQLAEKICEKLQQNGFQAFLAGGCVRDFLLKRQPHDFDVATSATPDQVEGLFPKTIAVGKSFGVIIVIQESLQVEVATFRKDGPYQDGRRPQSVEFSQAEEDAKRRDFTVNGLFFDFQSGQVIDYVDGLEDLAKKQLRAIGNPQKRFAEDHLRLLRAIRFSAQLGFQIEAGTWQALQSSKALISTVSGERIQDEISKLLLSPHLTQGLELFYQSGLLESLLGIEMDWQMPDLFFSRKEGAKEDAWFRFFFWLRMSFKESLPLSFFEGLCDRWKFSRDLRDKSLRSLKWTYEQKLFLSHPLGELLALSYEKENLRGFVEYSHFFLQDEEKGPRDQFLQRREQLGDQKPAPWVVAADLLGPLAGEALGQALRHCYWDQLEGKAQTKESLLKHWRK